MTTTASGRTRAKVDQQPTETLILALQTIETAGAEKPEERMVRAWIIDALEERYPAASDAVAEAFEASEARIIAGEEDVPEVDYVAVLVGAIRKAGN